MVSEPAVTALMVTGPDVAEDYVIPGWMDAGQWIEPRTIDMSAWRVVTVEGVCRYGCPHRMTQHFLARLYPPAVDRMIADMRREVHAAINACEGHGAERET